jgi:hypothetical protein
MDTTPVITPRMAAEAASTPTPVRNVPPAAPVPQEVAPPRPTTPGF